MSPSLSSLTALRHVVAAVRSTKLVYDTLSVRDLATVPNSQAISLANGSWSLCCQDTARAVKRPSERGFLDILPTPCSDGARPPDRLSLATAGRGTRVLQAPVRPPLTCASAWSRFWHGRCSVRFTEIRERRTVSYPVGGGASLLEERNLVTMISIARFRRLMGIKRGWLV